MKNRRQQRTKCDMGNLGLITEEKPTRWNPNRIPLLLEINYSVEIQSIKGDQENE